MELMIICTRLGSLTERSKTIAHSINEIFRLFPGSEVAALVEFLVVDHFRIRRLCPCFRSRIYFIRKDRHNDRKLYVPHGEEPPSRRQRVPCVPVETSR